MKRLAIVFLAVSALIALLLWIAPLAGADPDARPMHANPGPPQMVSYQGRVLLDGVPYSGTGYFKFAVVDTSGAHSYWSNDDNSESGSEPLEAVPLTVTAGLFDVRLGDTSLLNMMPLGAAVFSQDDRALRVWFSDYEAGFVRLAPDRSIAAAPYALQAQAAQTAANSSSVGGYPAGNGAGNVALNNGVLNSTLNADLLDGQHAADLAVPSGAIVLGLANDSRLASAGYTALGRTNVIGPGSWSAMAGLGSPGMRMWATPAWTGSEMLVWGGSASPTGSGLDTGGRYNPASDSWTAIATHDAPSRRVHHTAVWTGSDLLVWGGEDGSAGTNTGGLYNPAADGWVAAQLTEAPAGRAYHSAVWTGAQMIVWGGTTNRMNGMSDGRRYDPYHTEPGWPTPGIWDTIVAPPVSVVARWAHSAVWTGSEMLVWGGWRDSSTATNTGGRYKPDAWNAMTTAGAPQARAGHTAVWTGSEMLVWGGTADGATGLNTGGRYNPASDTWTAIPTLNAPQGRFYHSAVWTGHEMIIWGGTSDGKHELSNGARYNPGTNSWAAVTSGSAPEARFGHVAVWTGSQMLVWGGRGLVDALGGRDDVFLDVYMKP